MKAVTWLAAGVACALMTSVSPGTRAAERPRNTITIEPLAMILSRTVSLEYERVVMDELSFFVSPSLAVGSVTDGDAEASFLAYGASVGARLFPWGQAPAGPFVSGSFQLAWADAERRTVDDGGTNVTRSGSGSGYAVGAVAGYAWVFSGTFDLSLGLGANWTDVTVDIDGEVLGRGGLQWLGRVAVGVAF